MLSMAGLSKIVRYLPSPSESGIGPARLFRADHHCQGNARIAIENP